jgi:hypothetical protein
MGSIWLHTLPDALEGLNTRLYSGWEDRSRSSGGYNALMGIVVHHTASQTSTANDIAWMWQNSPDKPVGAIYVARDGEIVIGAAGATNCAGKGGPYTTSKGTIPLDSGNSNTINIEAGNNGVGEQWPTVQQDAYIALVAALCDYYDLDPLRDVLSHFEWAPDRKIDPAGNSRYASGGNKWDMDRFRNDVKAGAPSPGPEPEPEPEPPPSGGDWMADLPTIKKGASGAYVERMQHLLAAAGFMDPANTANYDGVWGNGTDGAKARFDNAHGLTPSPPTDCGDKSWESLMTGKKW